MHHEAGVTTRIVLAMFVLAACGSGATAPPPRDVRDMRANEHKDAARLHAMRAAELARISDGLREEPRTWKDDPKTGMWFRSLDEEHQAKLHLVAAERLEADYQERCAGLPRDEITISPLQRFSTGGMPKADGVIVFLTPAAGPPERLLRALRCHQAWMRLGEAEHDECPLELAGIDLVTYGDRTGISVEITMQDPAAVAELQRRAEHVIETGRHASSRDR